MTAAAKPGRREGGGTLDCCTCDLVLMEGGATRAAAVATWALVRATPASTGYVANISERAFTQGIFFCSEYRAVRERVGSIAGSM